MKRDVFDIIHKLDPSNELLRRDEKAFKEEQERKSMNSKGKLQKRKTISAMEWEDEMSQEMKLQMVYRRRHKQLGVFNTMWVLMGLLAMEYIVRIKRCPWIPP